MLIGGTLSSLQRQKNYHYLIAWSIPSICSIIPIFTKQYGSYQNNINIQDYECWIKSKYLQMIWVIFNILALFAHFITLLLALYKWRKSIIAFSHHYKQIVLQIIRFVMVYTLIRLLPTIDRIVELHRKTNSEPFWLIFGHHICLAITGIGNGFVWIINKRYDAVKNPEKHGINNVYINKLLAELEETTVQSGTSAIQTTEIITSADPNHNQTVNQNSKPNGNNNTHSLLHIVEH